MLRGRLDRLTGVEAEARVGALALLAELRLRAGDPEAARSTLAELHAVPLGPEHGAREALAQAAEVAEVARSLPPITG